MNGAACRWPRFEHEPLELEELDSGIPHLDHVEVEKGDKRTVLVHEHVVEVKVAMAQRRRRYLVHVGCER